MPFELFGEPWVLFRDEKGLPACIRDECAHRACPLSLGKVGDRLALTLRARHAAGGLQQMCYSAQKPPDRRGLQQPPACLAPRR